MGEGEDGGWTGKGEDSGRGRNGGCIPLHHRVEGAERGREDVLYVRHSS